jgi:hypothetical protein
MYFQLLAHYSDFIHNCGALTISRIAGLRRQSAAATALSGGRQRYEL